jgi:putative colanic acid biosysnthesis UDP-glucose lipid carrier transferase
MIRGSNTIINMSQRALDLFILIGLTLAVGDKMIPKELARVLSIYCSFLAVFVFSFFHMYQSWLKTAILTQLRILASAWLTVLVIFNIIILLLSSKEQLTVLSPFALFHSVGFNSWALLVFSGLAAERLLIYKVLMFIRKKGYNQQIAIIIGAGETGIKLAQYLYRNCWIGITVAGFFDDNLAKGTQVKNGSNVLAEVIGRIDQSHYFAKRNHVDLVFLALPMREEEQISRIVGELGTAGHAVLMVQDLFTFGLQKARTQHLGELQVLDFYLFPLWKKLFDIIFSVIILILTSPLWLIVMVAIKLEDRGPVFFQHARVMESGRRFNCLKFRTMCVDAGTRLEKILAQDPSLKQEWETNFKLKDDPRVTRVGRFLRRFSMDELPQFYNVLSGEMSVVGARPVVPEELEKYYRKVTLTYCAMKPGITGLWQVGARSNTVDYDTRVELDRWYIINCNLWLDLKIIAKTFWQVIRAKGAY